jgi:hypothetical protein
MENKITAVSVVPNSFVRFLESIIQSQKDEMEKIKEMQIRKIGIVTVAIVSTEVH